MAYDFSLKKKWFGGLDPDSVTEYITKIKAENNLLKKELANKEETSSSDLGQIQELVKTINELNEDAEKHRAKITSLEEQIALLEKQAQNANAENSKIAIESLNLANHYVQSAIRMSSEVSGSTVVGAEKSKELLGDSLDIINSFGKTMDMVKDQISDMMGSFEDISLIFENLKKFETLSVDPMTSDEMPVKRKLDDKAKLSLVD